MNLKGSNRSNGNFILMKRETSTMTAFLFVPVSDCCMSPLFHLFRIITMLCFWIENSETQEKEPERFHHIHVEKKKTAAHLSIFLLPSI